MYLPYRNLVSCFLAYNFLFRISQFIISDKYIFIQFSYTRILLPVFIKEKNKNINTSFPWYILQEEYYQVSSRRKKPKNGTTVFPKKKIPPGVPRNIKNIEKVTTRSTFFIWAMNIKKSIYMWDNVYNIIQRMESLISCIYHTTDLYNSYFFLKKINIFHFNLPSI